MNRKSIPSSELFPVVLLLGPPGSGKGTIGKLLAQAGSHVHLSSGEIFRGLAPSSPAGKLYYQYAHQGLLVPDEVTIQMWHHYVEGLIATNRYFPPSQLLLLDGIPRTIKQAELLSSYIEVKKVVALDMPLGEKLIQRMQKRALIERRMDDTDEKVLQKRLEVYQKETAQLLDHYPSSLVAHFNADQRPIEVLRDVLAELAKEL